MYIISKSYTFQYLMMTSYNIQILLHRNSVLFSSEISKHFVRLKVFCIFIHMNILSKTLHFSVPDGDFLQHTDPSAQKQCAVLERIPVTGNRILKSAECVVKHICICEYGMYVARSSLFCA